MAICVNGLGRQLASSPHLASAKKLAVFVRRKLAGLHHDVVEGIGDAVFLRNCLSRTPAARPSPLKIVAAEPTSDVKRFTDGIKTRDVPRFHCLG
jgi:hypothetical protein